MTKVALIIIYNHRFDQNIEVLERIYKKRFSHIFHLVPFYTGERENVIPVYDNSYYFQGFLAQAFRSFYRPDFTHYFFIADDLILNPRVDEHTFATEMPLPDGYSFISPFNSYNTDRRAGFWKRVEMAYEWRLQQNGLQAARELPTPEAAAERFQKLRVPSGPLRFEQIWEVPQTVSGWLRAIVTNPWLCARFLHARLTKRQFNLAYPLVGGYSDIFVISADTIKTFCHYCGVFAAANLFVEHAIPTALVLSTERIINCRDMKLRGRALWTHDDFKELEPFDRSLQRLLRHFPDAYLYLHPVKLSHWSQDLECTVEETLPNESLLAHTGHKNQLKDVRLHGGDLIFTSTGFDPYLFLPKVSLNPDRTTWVSLEITVPEKTTIQLFHQSCVDETFCEDRSIKSTVAAGRHTLAWGIEGRLNGHFRLDPGNVAGEYRIHRITFRQ